MWLLPARYELDIRLYTDKERKVLFKFIHLHIWAWGILMAKLFANLEGVSQVRKYSAAKRYTIELQKQQIPR